LRTICAFSILVQFSKFQTVNPGCPPSHTFPARLLFDERLAQSDIFAILNCPAIALSMFDSTV